MLYLMQIKMQMCESCFYSYVIISKLAWVSNIPAL